MKTGQNIIGKGLSRVGATVNNWISSRTVRPYHRLYAVGDGVSWVLKEEAKALAELAQTMKMSYGFVPTGWTLGIAKQVLFHSSQWILGRVPDQVQKNKNRVAFAYFHGYPNAQYPEFMEAYENFRKVHPYLSRIQVSHKRMQNVLLETGVESAKICRIPIAVDCDLFRQAVGDEKKRQKEILGLPQSSVVVGSFQKDGNGWGEGFEPKLIKGPDIFIQTVARLKEKIPELWVLLAGPARGYVKNGLERFKIPYRHVFKEDYHEIAPLYHALDLMLVASREEGGPKAVLESMASGVPLVSTKVGQAEDLVVHGYNGYLAEVESVDQLVEGALLALSSHNFDLRAAARNTAEQNTHRKHLPLWRDFFTGIVEQS